MPVDSLAHHARLLCLWCCLLAADGARAESAPWRFVAFGDTLSFETDSAVNTNILRALANSAVAVHPSFVLFLGDISTYGTAEGLTAWTNAMAPVFDAAIPIYPIVGNHEIYSGALLANVFGKWVPTNGPQGEVGSTFAVEWQNALILGFNNFSLTNSAQVNLPWLEAVVATNKRPHVIAAGHLPAFKVLHADCLDDLPETRNGFWRSLAMAGTRMYFSGHDHFYDHSRMDDGDGMEMNDVHQIIVGTGGAPLYPDGAYDGDNGHWTPVRIWHESGHGFVVVDIAGTKASCVWHRWDGSGSYTASPDVFSYDTASTRPFLRRAFSDGKLTLFWVGPAVLQSASTPAGPFLDLAASSPFAVTNSANDAAFYRLLAR